MKNMKKLGKLLSVSLAVLMLASVLVACGDKAPEKKETEGVDIPKETIVLPTVEVPTEKPTEEKPQPAAPIQLTIGSYNIANGSKVNHDMSKLARDITNAKLDIVGLEEVDQFCNRSNNMDTMKTLSELTGMPYYTFFKAINLAGTGPDGKGEYGIGVLSKYPILETERVELYSAGKEQRALGRTAIDVNGVTLNFFVTHVSYEETSIRTKQLKQINDIMKKYDNYLLVGDFNTDDFSEYAAFPDAGTVNTAEYHLPTFDSKGTSIDNIVYTKSNWTFSPPRTTPNKNSDHDMLYAIGMFTPGK